VRLAEAIEKNARMNGLYEQFKVVALGLGVFKQVGGRRLA
jgi:hypothetical protein